MESLRKHIEAIIDLTDDEFEYIASHFHSKKLRKHAFLVQEGDFVDNEHFVVKGALKAYVYDNEKAKEYIFQFAVEDWWITDREAFQKRTKAQISIDCLEDCEVLSISREDRDKLCREMPKFERYLFIKISNGYVSLQKRVLTLIKNNSKERYSLFMQQYPHLLQRIPKVFIASYLGVSRETLSRMSSK